MLRIARNDLSDLYRKDTVPGEGIVYEIKLSPLSKQDTFMWIKRRIQMALEFIA